MVGDINNDGTGSNDLMYVPTDAEISVMQFDPAYKDAAGNIQSPAVQQAALKSFIAQDEYLASRRGQYTEKYAGETPGSASWMCGYYRILISLVAPKKEQVQFSIDIQNFGNMLNSKWGVRKYATYVRILPAIGCQQCYGHTAIHF
jgi:hypothetical protein